MAIKSFKDLTVWQKSEVFVTEIYSQFTTCRDFGFRDQIQRASISISNNIAEGYGRQSDRALAHFLMISRGSAAEVESMLLMAHKLGYIDSSNQAALLDNLDEISKLLKAFRSRVLANR